uniref:Uncharacterized protein n=1 Tax=Meloidogyne javanica TaxID=6303 RepID=A0A915LPX5_MELJA
MSLILRSFRHAKNEKYEELERQKRQEWHWKGVKKGIGFMSILFIAEPSREKLLPDPVKAPYHQPKYTVVLELRNVLVSPQWDAAPIVTQIDPQGQRINHALFRDCTKYVNGTHVK